MACGKIYYHPVLYCHCIHIIQFYIATQTSPVQKLTRIAVGLYSNNSFLSIYVRHLFYKKIKVLITYNSIDLY